ncbi:MAG: hypothetical protein IT242_00760 [Bacteroidia bacterium]|nr:hypothetical protein [Bacteroidia bacterium]
MKRFPDILIAGLALFTIGLCFASGSGFLEPAHAVMKSSLLTKKWEIASPDPSMLHSGDLIFRQGRGVISNSLRCLNREDPSFSHAGIIHLEKGKVFVYHCIGGEENVSSRMRKESLRDFCSPDYVHSFAIYQLQVDEHRHSMMDSIAGSWYRKGLRFDTDFDLSTDSAMYCTEMVYKVIKASCGNEIYLPLTRLAGRSYVTCDNLYLHTPCTSIYHYSYPN